MLVTSSLFSGVTPRQHLLSSQPETVKPPPSVSPPAVQPSSVTEETPAFTRLVIHQQYGFFYNFKGVPKSSETGPID